MNVVTLAASALLLVSLAVFATASPLDADNDPLAFALAELDSKAIRRTYVCADGSYIQQLKKPPPPNGCGPASAPAWVRKVASAITPFEPCCNVHDVCYSIANTLQKDCDDAFGACMLKRCDDRHRRKIGFIPNPIRSACDALARKVYFYFVREAGGPAFEAAQKAIGCTDQRELLAGTDDDWARMQRGEKRRPGTGPQQTQPTQPSASSKTVDVPVASSAVAAVSSSALQPAPRPPSSSASAQSAVAQSAVGSSISAPTSSASLSPLSSGSTPSSSLSGLSSAPSTSSSSSASMAVPASSTESLESEDDEDDDSEEELRRARRRGRKARALRKLTRNSDHVTIVKNDNTLVHKT